MSVPSHAFERSAIGNLQPRRLTSVIQTVGMVRKELMDMFRQPRLMLVLVVGPFLILTLFAAGYDQGSVRLRTIFVGPEESIYESGIDSYGANISEYVETIDYTSDVVAAREALDDGSVDLVVIFPPDPAENILVGERAEISILHQKLDPLQQTAVEIAASFAVSELNSAVLERLVDEAQETLVPLQESVDDADDLARQLGRAADAGDRAGVDVTSADLRLALSGADRIVSLTDGVVGALEGDADPEQTERLRRLRSTVAEMQLAVDDVDAATSSEDVQRAASRVDDLAAQLGDEAGTVVTIDPEVVVRPFAADTENLVRQSLRLSDFFAPSAISLILQHLAITLAALTLVRDSKLGLYETYRVAPISARHVLAGKYLSFVLFGGVVAAALVAAAVIGLDTPLRGSAGWVALGLALLMMGSIGLGLLLSVVARTDTQAVQYSMLVLLAALFFGGFFLSLDAFRFPIRLLSWTLPVTYSIRWLQDVMLRGEAPAPADVVGSLTLIVVYGALAWILFARRLAVR